MVSELEKQMARALETTTDCLEDIASGKGGWAWEEVLQEAREALAAYDHKAREQNVNY
jgi:hypothetical protein